MAHANDRRFGGSGVREEQPRGAEAVIRGEVRGAAGLMGSRWDGSGWIIGHDGKARRVEPSIRLLAHGVLARVGKLRAFGNAIVPAVAAEVIGAYLDCAP